MAESISEGTLKSWLKKPGEAVEADEEVATIETDKVSPISHSIFLTCINLSRSSFHAHVDAVMFIRSTYR